jgi:Flp pilus assembly CpaF family ATPase
MLTIRELFTLHHNRIQANFEQHFWRNMQAKERQSIDQLLASSLAELGIQNYAPEHVQFLRDWYERLMYLAYLDPYLAHPALQEILLHGHQGGQIDQGGPLIPFQLDLNPAEYQQSLEVLALEHHQAWNFAQPYASFYLHLKGMPFRGTLIHHSALALPESKLFLRRLRTQSFAIKSFWPTAESEQHQGPKSRHQGETLSPLDLKNIGPWLQEVMMQKKNILLSGATSSGKTSLLQTLLGLIPPQEHVIILEDTHEISPPHPYCTSFLATGLEQHTLADYCAYALRMRPDRLILGEMRGREVIPFMLAMNTGHQGLMSSIHADSASQALERVSILFNLFSPHPLDAFYVMAMICRNIHYVIHLEHKKIKEIITVRGQDQGRPFFDYLYP